MPRARGHTNYRGAIFDSYVSGVTFQTSPSGTTIVKSGVTATVISGTNINATSLKGTNLTNAGGAGYTLPFLGAAGLLCDVGEVAVTTGVTKVDASYFGMAAVYFCLATAGSTNVMNKSSATGAVVVTTANGFKSAGVSRVYFRYFGDAGTKLTKPVSVQYFAVGV